MSKHERQVESAETDDDSDGWLAKARRGLMKALPWIIVGAVVLAAI